ncbi:MAG: gliding motility protein GldN [Flavobacteriaceae bacterium]|jgi:gliding motility associated protien GldN|nr:gliding motility protein GldN [Flavobacteriaceae bacterium]
MKKSLFVAFLFTLTFSVTPVMGQANLLNARVPQEVGKLNEQQVFANDEEPLAYGFIDDRDVLWSKTVWEKIDLDERINFPYYYPSEPQNLGEDRRSLYDVLVQGIEDGRIKEVYGDRDGYFRDKFTYEQVLEEITFSGYNLGYEGAVNEGILTEQQIEEKYGFSERIKSRDVVEYRIKGTWYFDKRQGEMKFRLLGIAPCAPDKEIYNPQLEKGEIDKTELYPLFWVWFPDAREVLNEAYVFNTRNSSQPISFDHMLNSRRFNSVIYKEENVYQDRQVDSYIYEDALQQLLESERIKSVIRDFEQDMWNN